MCGSRATRQIHAHDPALRKDLEAALRPHVKGIVTNHVASEDNAGSESMTYGQARYEMCDVTMRDQKPEMWRLRSPCEKQRFR
eukprot:12410617-Karenia_brevis.AAC.1